MTVALQHVGGFEQVEFVADKREYRIGEIVSHFGVSFKRKWLADIGSRLEKSFLGRRVITVARPEQFIAVVRKKQQGLK